MFKKLNKILIVKNYYLSLQYHDYIIYRYYKLFGLFEIKIKIMQTDKKDIYIEFLMSENEVLTKTIMK